MASHQKLYCDTLGCKMAYAVKGIMGALNERFTDEGINLTLEQFFLLNILNNEEGLILQDLADIVDRDKSAVLRHINGLEEKHYVARTKDPEDKRRKILLITKAGFEELQKAKALDQELDEEIVSQISTDQLEKLEEFLADIYNQTVSDSFC